MKACWMQLLTVSLLLGSLAHAQDLTPEKAAKIREQMTPELGPGGLPLFDEHDLKSFAGEYGQEAMPLLIELLKDPSVDHRNKMMICSFLGAFEDPRAVAPIIAHIEALMDGELSFGNLPLIQLSLTGLGRTKAPDAVDYLEQATQAEFWKDVNISVPPDYTREDLVRYLRIFGMQGLTFAGEAGLARLRALENVGDVLELNGEASVAFYIREAQDRISGQESHEEMTPLARTEEDALFYHIEAPPEFGSDSPRGVVDHFPGRDISPSLIRYTDDRKNDIQNRLRAMAVLAATGQDTARDKFLSIIHQPLPQELTGEEYNFLLAAIHGLGECANKNDLALLKQMFTDEYWTNRNAVATAPDTTPERFRESVRRRAMWAIALTGFPEAVSLFEDPQGVPAEFESERVRILEWATERAAEKGIETQTR